MTSIDLTAARAAMTGRLVDTCRIAVDPEAETDDTVDPDTLELVHPDGDASALYEGPCLLGPVLSEQNVEVGERRITRRRYRARLPHDAPIPPVGATFTLTAAANDTQLVDIEMRVTDVALRTYEVSRQVYLQHDGGERP